MNNEAGKVRCPFYETHNTGKSASGNNITLTCELPIKNLGFDIKNKLVFKSLSERRDYMELFCMEQYIACPYYKFISDNYEEET